MSDRPSRRRRGARLLTALAALALLAPAVAAAQDSALHVPRAMKQAYAAGTRSRDGHPGPKYWQNHARYTIDLSVAPPARAVTGREQIVYVNESPDTLRELTFKLFMNIHKPGAPRAGGASEDYLTSGVHVDRFAVNGAVAPWNDSPRYFTWVPVKLPTPLLPHDSVQLAIDWHYDLSKQDGREGMIDSTTAYLAYFYPRVAVYDDVNGWDRMDFNDRQEFYSDFNDYDVTLHVPGDFVVWGTGTLTNADALLQPAPLARFRQSFTSDTTIHVATVRDFAARAVTKPAATNAWHFVTRDIPDVAFATSDHYDWDAASVLVDDAAHRRASVQSAYSDTAADFHHMVQFGRHALDFFSHRWPGVPYPYEKSTIVQGSADMEYPMMVNDGSTPDTAFSKFVAEHEIAHTYFPFYMGIDETRWGFMDEGWATTLEHFIAQEDVGVEKAVALYQDFRVKRWINDPSPVEDVPVISPEDVLGGLAYGNNAYVKASLGYLAARDLLGDGAFHAAVLEYMRRWHGKHPQPWDFFYTINDATGRNLNWFWHAWYYTQGYIDLAVRGVSPVKGGTAVTVDNVGGWPAPFDVRVTYRDGSTASFHETPAVWRANLRRAVVRVPTTRPVASVELTGGVFMDADTTNNRWSAR